MIISVKSIIQISHKLELNAMGLKNKTIEAKETFSVAKTALFQSVTTINPPSKRLNKPIRNKIVPEVSDRIAGIDLASIKKIETKLKLTFLSEKDNESKVCMANTAEVRDEFKDIFDKKDLLDYSYAVLHSPNYLEKYQDLSIIEDFQISYPTDSHLFWKLVDLGSKLRDRNLLKTFLDEKDNNDIDEILKKIAALKID